MSKDKSLSDLQAAIMRILWESGEATVSEVHQSLSSDKSLATTTVATMLSRLEKRGLIHHLTEGRQYLYYPLVSEEEVRTSMVGDLVKRIFKGNFSALASHLLKESDMSAQELEQLKKMIADKEEEEGKQDV